VSLRTSRLPPRGVRPALAEGVRRRPQAFRGRRSAPPADQITQPADPRHRQNGPSRGDRL